MFLDTVKIIVKDYYYYYSRAQYMNTRKYRGNVEYINGNYWEQR